jgi:hypothetical protein
MESWPLRTPSVWISRLKKIFLIAIKSILLISTVALFALPFLTPRTEIKSRLKIKEVCGTPGKTKFLQYKLCLQRQKLLIGLCFSNLNM